MLCGQAINAGADALKWFPTDGMSPKSFKAMLAVLPSSVPVLAVGGVDVGNIACWRTAGARGFGVGSAIWKPGLTAAQVEEKASVFVRACEVACGRAAPLASKSADRGVEAASLDSATFGRGVAFYAACIGGSLCGFLAVARWSAFSSVLRPGSRR